MESNCELAGQDERFESYLLGRLTEAEQQTFEVHFLECAECFEKLESFRALQIVLSDAAGSIASSWPARKSNWRWAIAAGLAFVVVAAALTVRPRLPRAGSPIEFSSIDAPLYVAERLRGATDESSRRFRQAMENYLEQDYSTAIAKLEAVSDIDPGSPRTHFYLGACYLLTGRDEPAISNLELAVALDDGPYLEEAHYLLAEAHIRRGDYESAREELEETIRMDGELNDEARTLLEHLAAVQ